MTELHQARNEMSLLVEKMDHLLELAAIYLGITEHEAKTHHKFIPSIPALYVWDNAHGGNSLLMDSEGFALIGSPELHFGAHIAAFHCGERTELEQEEPAITA